MLSDSLQSRFLISRNEFLLLNLVFGAHADMILFHGQERNVDVNQALFNQMTFMQSATPASTQYWTIISPTESQQFFLGPTFSQ